MSTVTSPSVNPGFGRPSAAAADPLEGFTSPVTAGQVRRFNTMSDFSSLSTQVGKYFGVLGGAALFTGGLAIASTPAIIAATAAALGLSYLLKKVGGIDPRQVEADAKKTFIAQREQLKRTQGDLEQTIKKDLKPMDANEKEVLMEIGRHTEMKRAAMDLFGAISKAIEDGLKSLGGKSLDANQQKLAGETEKALRAQVLATLKNTWDSWSPGKRDGSEGWEVKDLKPALETSANTIKTKVGELVSSLSMTEVSSKAA